MQFKENADVYTETGDKVGTLHSTVIDPRSKEVTDLVIRHGFLFTEDRVAPVDMVAEATADRIVLKGIDDEKDLRPFEETHYLPLEDIDDREITRSYPMGYTRPLYAYPPAGMAWWSYPGFLGERTRPYVTTHEKNIPEGTVTLDEGADIYSADGKHVGDVESLYVDAETEHATHLVISQGLLFKSHKLVPTSWIDHITGEGVYLLMDAEALDRLPDYEPER